jgi:carbon monoxide dehydrogenase subunit G
MKVSGDAVLRAPIEHVWAALNDPEVLRRTIPGCERLDAVGADSYSMTVSAGVGSIKGSYAGEVALSDQRMPSSFLLTASGAGAPGTVRTQVRVGLATLDDGATRLTYDADAEVGGMVAGVGQRMLAAVAKKLAKQFFLAVEGELLGVPATGAGLGGSAASTGVGKAAGGTAGGTGQLAATGGVGAGIRSASGAGRPSGGPDSDFARGAIIGAAIALAGVLTGALAGRILNRRWL